MLTVLSNNNKVRLGDLMSWRQGRNGLVDIENWDINPWIFKTTENIEVSEDKEKKDEQ